jgi:hypothetical protein
MNIRVKVDKYVFEEYFNVIVKKILPRVYPKRSEMVVKMQKGSPYKITN